MCPAQISQFRVAPIFNFSPRESNPPRPLRNHISPVFFFAELIRFERNFAMTFQIRGEQDKNKKQNKTSEHVYQPVYQSFYSDIPSFFYDPDYFLFINFKAVFEMTSLLSLIILLDWTYIVCVLLCWQVLQPSSDVSHYSLSNRDDSQIISWKYFVKSNFSNISNISYSHHVSVNTKNKCPQTVSRKHDTVTNIVVPSLVQSVQIVKNF